MGRKEKLIERFKKLPKDFTFEEVETMMSYFGYFRHNKGATSGSRIRFFCQDKNSFIDLHRPHPGSIMKEWMMKRLYLYLKENGLI
jgi:hypothetical protein